MELAREVAQYPWTSLSIVGTVKNAGKTTVLNYLYGHLYELGFSLGLMSTGRDGEAVDQVTNEPKPPILVRPGTVVATAHHSLVASDAYVEVLTTLPIATRGGDMVLARVRQEGAMELLGPAAAADVRQVIEALGHHGARRILVDGSMDRRRAAAPHVTGYVILASGASLSPQRRVVIDDTALCVEFLQLGPVPELHLAAKLQELDSKQVMLLDDDGHLTRMEWETALSREESIVAALAPTHEGVVLPGAFTDGLARALTEHKRPLRVMVTDATCVFLSRPVYRRFCQWGGHIEVLHPIRLIAVCLNPVGPQGVSFAAGDFMDAMAQAVPHVPLFDIVSGLYRKGG